MKTLMVLLLISCCIFADARQPGHHRKKTRNIIWVTPSYATHINGLAIGLVATPLNHNTQTINGLNIELLPTIILLPGYIVQTLSLPVVHYNKDTINNPLFFGFTHKNDTVTEYINGLNLSAGSLFACRRTTGLSISLSANSSMEHRGVSISGVANWVNHFNGLLIAPAGNVCESGTGIQLGLVNSCINCSGLQVGLLNQNGHRITPFIGYRSRRRAARIAAGH